MLAAILLHEKSLPTTIIGIVIILIGSVITFVGNRTVEDTSVVNKLPEEKEVVAEEDKLGHYTTHLKH